MFRALRAASALSHRRILVPSSAFRPHTRRYIADYRPHERVPRLERRPNSTQAGMQASEDLTHRPANYDAFANFLDEFRRRTLPRGNSFLNTADQIENQLRENGHRIWGLAIYRCTYGDDAAWETCLERLKASIREAMRYYNGLDLLEEDRFKLTVFDDASRFDGADTHFVRQHFKDWRGHAVHEEQVSPEETEARREEARRKWFEDPYDKRPTVVDQSVWESHGHGHDREHDYRRMAVRYRLCVQIDEAALRSIISSEGERTLGDAWVNVVEGDWDPEAAAAQRERDKIEGIEMGLDPEDFDDDVEVFPEIDGCTEKNVGWMKVQYKDLIPEFYAGMVDHNAFEDMYERPPGIGTA